MTERFSGAELTVECPNCGTRSKHSLGHLRMSPQLRCVACESRLQVDGEQLRTALAMLEAAAQAMLDGGVKKIG